MANKHNLFFNNARALVPQDNFLRRGQGDYAIGGRTKQANISPNSQLAEHTIELESIQVLGEAIALLQKSIAAFNLQVFVAKDFGYPEDGYSRLCCPRGRRSE